MHQRMQQIFARFFLSRIRFFLCKIFSARKRPIHAITYFTLLSSVVVSCTFFFPRLLIKFFYSESFSEFAEWKERRRTECPIRVNFSVFKRNYRKLKILKLELIKNKFKNAVDERAHFFRGLGPPQTRGYCR